MLNHSPNLVDPLTVDHPGFDTRSFAAFIDKWRAELARGGRPRLFDFERAELARGGRPRLFNSERAELARLPVLPVKVENQKLIEIPLAAKGAKLGVFITPDSLYTVGFVCQRGDVYALFDNNKHLLPNRVNAKAALLKGETYGKMGGFIHEKVDRDSLAKMLRDAIHGLATYEEKGNTDDLGKKMGVIVQVIIEPIRFRKLQEQYIEIFSANARQVALRTPRDISKDNEGGSGQNDRVASDPFETVKVHGTYINNSRVVKLIEKNWISLSKIALEAHENDKYKEEGYELKGCETYSYMLKNNVLIEFPKIEHLVKAFGVAKEKESSMISKITSYFQKRRK